jgi:hypothetical protein
MVLSDKDERGRDEIDVAYCDWERICVLRIVLDLTCIESPRFWRPIDVCG